jgi:ribonuclease HI
MSDAELVIHIDGAARGNPGPAAYAFVIESPGGPTVEEAGRLGNATNNIAEYTALVKVLERLAAAPPARLRIYSDSELLVKQMTGEYRVKNEDLKVLADEARQLLRRHRSVTFTHVPRAQNQRADQLCNDALDGLPLGAPRPRKVAAAPATTVAGLHEDAVLCLRAAAAEWAKGDANRPDPAQVWDQLWSILEENGVLKRKN